MNACLSVFEPDLATVMISWISECSRTFSCSFTSFSKRLFFITSPPSSECSTSSESSAVAMPTSAAHTFLYLSGISSYASASVWPPSDSSSLPSSECLISFFFSSSSDSSSSDSSASTSSSTSFSSSSSSSLSA